MNICIISPTTEMNSHCFTTLKDFLYFASKISFDGYVTLSVYYLPRIFIF